MFISCKEMKLFYTLLIFSVTFSLSLATKCSCGTNHPPPCPPCNPLAGCPIWNCPCTHEGFTLFPGYHQLNPPRPSSCPPCIRECPDLAIRCRTPYLPCDSEQVATYKCYEPINIPVKMPIEDVAAVAIEA